MEEDEKDADRTDVLHEEEVEVEEAAAEGTPVGELVTHNLVRYEPTDEDAGEEADNRQEDLACDEVKPIEERLAEELQ